MKTFVRSLDLFVLRNIWYTGDLSQSFHLISLMSMKSMKEINETLKTSHLSFFLLMSNFIITFYSKFVLVPTSLTYAVIVLSQELGGFVLIHFNSSAHNPATSSVTAVIISLPKYLICSGLNKKPNNSSQIEDVYDCTWARKQSCAPLWWSTAWVLCGSMQRLIRFDLPFFLLPELPAEPFPFQVKQKRPSGVLPLGLFRDLTFL